MYSYPTPDNKKDNIYSRILDLYMHKNINSKIVLASRDNYAKIQENRLSMHHG
jgi:hypothetical protein